MSQWKAKYAFPFGAGPFTALGARTGSSGTLCMKPSPDPRRVSSEEAHSSIWHRKEGKGGRDSNFWDDLGRFCRGWEERRVRHSLHGMGEEPQLPPLRF